MGRPRKSEEEKRAKKAAYMKEYWKTHRAEQNAARKRWRENHPEEERKRASEYYRRWIKLNKEKYNAYQREYYQRRKRQAMDEAKLDKKEHPDTM